MSPARKRLAAALAALVALVGAYLLGRTDGDELSGLAFLIGILVVAFLCVAAYGLGWEHRRDEENALEAERAVFRAAAERHRRPETGATLTTHALAVAVLLLGVLWCSYTFGADDSSTTPVGQELGR